MSARNRLSRRCVLQSSGALLIGTTLAEAQAPTRSTDTARLNYNESPFGPSPRARQAIRDSAASAWKYAYQEVPALRSMIAGHEGVGPENVFVSEGSGEILKLMAMIHGAAGSEIVVTRPTFPMLPRYAAHRGATVTWVGVDAKFGHDFAALSRAINDATRVVYVCNPNNPTGILADRETLRAFITAAARQTLVVVDEAYIEFAPQPARSSVVDLVGSGGNLLVTRSFSKIYGLAGLRVGYGIAEAGLIRQLESLRFSIPNQAGVAAARASHGDADFRARICGKIRDGVAFCGRLFEEVGMRYLPTSANFVMFDTGRDDASFVEFARAQGVMVAPVEDPWSRWARVTMGRPEDMQSFARALRAYRDHGARS